MSTQSLTSKLGFSSTFENVGYVPVVGVASSVATIVASILDLNQEMEGKKLNKKELSYLTAYNIVNVLSLGTLGACFGIAKLINNIWNKCIAQLKPMSTAIIAISKVHDETPVDESPRLGCVHEKNRFPGPISLENLQKLINDPSTQERVIQDIIETRHTDGKSSIELNRSSRAAKIVLARFPNLLCCFSETIQTSSDIKQIAFDAQVNQSKLPIRDKV